MLSGQQVSFGPIALFPCTLMQKSLYRNNNSRNWNSGFSFMRGLSIPFKLSMAKALHINNNLIL